MTKRQHKLQEGLDKFNAASKLSDLQTKKLDPIFSTWETTPKPGYGKTISNFCVNDHLKLFTPLNFYSLQDEGEDHSGHP